MLTITVPGTTAPHPVVESSVRPRYFQFLCSLATLRSVWGALGAQEEVPSSGWVLWKGFLEEVTSGLRLTREEDGKRK